MADKLEVRLFGGVSFLLNNKPVKSLPTRAAQALFIYLLHQKTPVERERLIDMFYQASSPKQAAANFRSILSRMRKELAPFLEITNRSVRILPNANIWVDAQEFAKQLGDQESIEAPADTLSLYQGDFLAGFFLREAPEFEQWVVVEQERLRLLALENFKQLIRLYAQKGQYWDALQAVNQLLMIDPLNEAMHRQKMLLLTRTGQREQALRHVAETAVFLETELGIALSPETTALHERINGLKIPPPGLIPTAVDQFIGRENELSTLLKLLAKPERRLITLFGIGGTGKTRLAMEAARTLAAQNSGMFLDGIYAVSMVGVKKDAAPADIALHILQSIEQGSGGQQSPADLLINNLKKREALLVLDNFEHLAEKNGRFLSQLLRAAPDIKLLITSRARLNLVEETVFDLEGLPYSSEETIESDAAYLFVNHAQRHRFTFTPANEDIPAIANMCRLLEGSPLGIELAAGAIRDTSCAVILQQIEKNLGELASPLQNVPQRHRSLRAVFLHSWGLLPSALRPVYANLSIFPASFDQTAAQTIANAAPADLAHFVDKAMLKEHNGRYTIHPILREFAAEQLTAAQTSQLRSKHTAYFAEFIGERSKTFHRPTYLKEMPDLLTAYDDLVPAWQWAIEQLAAHETESAWQWVGTMRRPLMRLHFQRSWFYAARELLKQARLELEEAGWHLKSAPGSHRLLHAQLTVAECNCTRIMGDVVAAIVPTEQAIPLLREHVALDDLFDAYNLLTGCHMQLREFDKVPDYLEEMEAIASESQKRQLFGVYYVSRSYYEDYMGHTEESLAWAEQALDAFRSLDDTFYEAITLDGIARRLKTLKRDDEALAVLHQAYQLAEENEQTLTKAFLQRGIAQHYRDHGALAKAETAVSLSRRLFTEVNDLRYLVDIDYLEALIAYDRKQWAEMTRFLIATLQRALAYVIKRHTLNTLAFLPILQWQRGEKEQAIALYLFAKQHPEFDSEQHEILALAKEMMGTGLTPKAEASAQAAADTLDQDTILNNFLQEGLRWFG